MFGKGEGPNICIIGEMDAVKCFRHPYADSDTGAAHACGHNAQIASMLGVAISLGFNTKQISFKVKAVHTSEPFEGVNALNAAMLHLWEFMQTRKPSVMRIK